MEIYKAFATDQRAETEGIILDYGQNAAGNPVQIRVARAGGSNQRFAKSLEARMRPYKRLIANDTLDPKIAERVLIDSFADAVVLGWAGITGPDGLEIPFSRENVVRVFTDLPDLFADVQQQSQKSALFRAEIREAESGN
ncbi:MAG: hypothetical protein DDT26_00034 [Dehalococcoidia bacterium]|nr:hypothetical protein [Chloroflexota bacterium]